MNTDTTKKVQAAEVTFADDAFSPLPEHLIRITLQGKRQPISRMYGEILRRISQQ